MTTRTMREGIAMELTNETSASAPEAAAAPKPETAAAAQQRADWPLAAAFFGVVLAIYAVLGYLAYALIT
jgi:hypothetical protein